MAEPVTLSAEDLADLRQQFDRDELSLVSEGFRKNKFGGFDEWSTRMQPKLAALLLLAEVGMRSLQATADKDNDQ